MNQYPKTDKYDKKFVYENMMGPNSMIVLEELLENNPIKKGMKVLDLGCGKGLTSVFLAKEYDVQVFAVDLWIKATDNYKNFQQMNVADKVIPIHSDAHELPFAEDYFDAVISIDAYHYFGANDKYFDKYLKPLLKNNALVALAFPGMKFDIHSNVPEEMEKFWPDEALITWQTVNFWKDIFNKSLKDLKVKEMSCFNRAWNDWLPCDNEHAIGDRDMIKTDNNRFMNLVSVLGRKKK